MPGTIDQVAGLLRFETSACHVDRRPVSFAFALPSVSTDPAFRPSGVAQSRRLRRGTATFRACACRSATAPTPSPSATRSTPPSLQSSCPPFPCTALPKVPPRSISFFGRGRPPAHSASQRPFPHALARVRVFKRLCSPNVWIAIRHAGAGGPARSAALRPRRACMGDHVPALGLGGPVRSRLRSAPSSAPPCVCHSEAEEPFVREAPFPPNDRNAPHFGQARVCGLRLCCGGKRDAERDADARVLPCGGCAPSPLPSPPLPLSPSLSLSRPL